MTFLAIAFIAGVLTVLAPCILPLLPVVIGSSASGRSKATPYIVVTSLALSIIIFTFLLKASTAFITVPQAFWTYLSGTILVFFGVTLLFPRVWESIPGLSKLTIRSNKLLGSGHQKKSIWGDIIIGAALGPVFSTCSPTYFVILASVLPASFALGTLYLLAYVAGLSLVLLLIAVLGERFASRLSGISNPHSWFKRGLGILFVLVGLFIMSGLDKQLQTYVLDTGFFDITRIEQKLLQDSDKSPAADTVMPYVEIKNPSGFVNTNDQPIKISDYVGKQVILLDIMTYSCINCQRTFPYINAWYEKYKDDGLIVIGIHTPEFAFERDKGNVEKAMEEFGIKFPVVLDNEYATWNALGNRFWPRKYLVDIHGNIVYDHIGEGAYEETEQKIQELLKERAAVLGASVTLDEALAASGIDSSKTTSKSPETYFGAARNEYLANGNRGVSGEQTFTVPSTIALNKLYFGGVWNISAEFAQASQSSVVMYKYNAKEVFIVAESEDGGTIEVWQDGKQVDVQAGADAPSGQAAIQASRLYKLIKNSEPGEHTLELKVSPGVKLLRLPLDKTGLLYCHTMAHTNYYLDLCVEVYIVYHDAVLLRLHEKYNLWTGPGGHIDPGEDCNEAALREVWEEVGLKVELVGPTNWEKQDTETNLDLIPPIFMNRHRINEMHEHSALIFIGKAQTNKVQAQTLEDEGVECRWVTKVELDDMAKNDSRLRPEVYKYAAHALARIVG